MRRFSRSILLGMSLVWSVSVASADSTADALAFFRDYEARASRFDPSLSDLYSDDALIKSRRLVPGESPQELTFGGQKWKAMIRQFMPLAQQRGDRNTFSKVAAKVEGDQVVVTAERYSHLKGYTSPFTLVLRKDRTGPLRIVEERSETRP